MRRTLRVALGRSNGQGTYSPCTFSNAKLGTTGISASPFAMTPHCKSVMHWKEKPPSSRLRYSKPTLNVLASGAYRYL